MPQPGRPEVNPFAVQCTLNLCIATPQTKQPTFRPTAGSHVSGSLVKFLLLGLAEQEAEQIWHSG